MKHLQPGRLGLVFILILSLGAVVTGQPATTALGRASPGSYLQEHAGPVSERLLLRSSTETSLSLEWTAPEVRLSPDEPGYMMVQADGLEQVGEPGEERLPVDAYLMALPAGAQAQIEFASVEAEERLLERPLALNPQPQGVLKDSQGRPVGGDWAPAERTDGRPGQAGRTEPARLEEAGNMRGVRLVRLVFYPALAEAGKLRVFQRIQININWDIPAKAGAGDIDDPMIAQLQNQVINPWMVVADMDQPQALDMTAAQQPGIYLEIDHSGIYRLGYQDLVPYGLTNFDPAHLRLFRGTQEVAYFWEGDGDNIFEPTDSLLFYADRRFSRWTELDVLHLVSDPNLTGKRMVTRSASPTGIQAGAPQVEILAEENLVYTPDCFCKALPGRDGDHWVWKKLAQPDQNQVELSFSTPAVYSSLPAELTLWFISYSESKNIPLDHRVDVALNGDPLGSITWDGKQAVARVLAIPASKLLSGENKLTLTLPLNIANYYDQLWLDAFQVRYTRSNASSGQAVKFQAEAGTTKAYTIGLSGSAPYFAFDVSDPLDAARLVDFAVNGSQVSVAGTAGGRYWLASGTAVTAPKAIRLAADPWQFQPGGAPNGADYVIITHPAFAGAVQPLVSLRQAKGHTVSVVNVLGIYDTWGDGRIDPQAIRAFLSQAYSSWQPRPLYVLLVGDGSSDPRHYLTTETTFIPPYLVDVDPWAGETAADNRYVAVSGSDAIPDMLLGRLPVQTLAEAQAAITKIVQYETNPYPSPWNANVLLAADDIDWAGNFYDLNYKSGQIVLPPFKSLHLACQNPGNSTYYSDCPEALSQQIHASLLNWWNSGTLLVQYTGHASWQQWAEERFFHLDDLPALLNARRLPVAIEMTCFTGAFQRPEPTLDEELVLLPAAGAVAAWGSTGLGVSTGHDRLSQGFFQAVFQANVITLGEAALAGKLNLASTNHNLDLLDTFNILGDPALRFNRQIVPWANQVFLPQISR